MPYPLTDNIISQFAIANAISIEQAKAMLDAASYEESEADIRNREIIDRINRRIQGEYVVPVWMEGSFKS